MDKYIGFTGIPRESFAAGFDASSNVIRVITTGYTIGTAIAFYDGDTLIASGSLAGGEATGIADGIVATLENQDDNFTGFDENGQYKVVIDDMLQTVNYIGVLDVIANFTQEDVWILATANGKTGAISFEPIKISVSQTKTTTKKKYDTKLLSEELLPKIVAKKSDVAAVKKAAETAQSTAETAQSTAETAQSTAETAQSTAETAQSTAETAQSTAETAQSTANNAVSKYGNAIIAKNASSSKYYGIKFNFYSSYNDCEISAGGFDTTATKFTASSTRLRVGGTNNDQSLFSVSTPSDRTPPSIALTNYNGTLLTITGAGEIRYAGDIFLPYSTGIIIKSSTSGSVKQFKITVDDTGTISAAEVTT